MSYYYHQMENCKHVVEMVVSSVLVVVVDILKDEEEHYCDVPLCLFDQLLTMRNSISNKTLV